MGGIALDLIPQRNNCAEYGNKYKRQNCISEVMITLKKKQPSKFMTSLTFYYFS